MKEKYKFPVVKAGTVFNKFSSEKKASVLRYNKIEINYPCRLDAMAINPAAVTYNDEMIFTPGEVVFSLKKFINVKINVVSPTGGNLSISSKTKRKVLVKHSYLLMCDALNISPSLEIEVDDSKIPKHCGFGSSSSIIASVAAAINEIYSKPIEDKNLIKYLASNHGEEVSDEDADNIKVVQCIGGGASNGLTDEGILIIAGKSCIIGKMFYEGDVLIGIPNKFVSKDALYLMQEEEKNLWKFKKTGDEYKDVIAYDILHKVLPEMTMGKIDELAKIVYEYRFNMGSIENCSFVYPPMVELGEKLRELYLKKKCDFLALSSVGPAYFAIVKDKKQKEYCMNYMKKLDMDVYESTICNTKYEVVDTKSDKCFWEQESTNLEFRNRPPSKYITDVIDEMNIKNKKCIDIGCGGGRYSKYLNNNGGIVLSIDKYPEMFGNNNNINFIRSNMDNIPVVDESYDLALSIGVIHNSVTTDEYKKSVNEIYRLLKKNGHVIFSTFTNDVITDDLCKYDDNLYYVENRPPMVLFSKDDINKIVEKSGFKIVKVVDEHVTDVGGGCRNVYTLLLEK